ncbi:hypothetical protein ACYSN5_04660 [Bacillus spizizenii]
MIVFRAFNSYAALQQMRIDNF